MGLQESIGLLADPSTSPRPAQFQGVLEGAENRLRHNPYLALKNISCDFREGVLTLHGCVPSYYLKQMAQTAVSRVEGVQRIVNAIEVIGGTGR